MPQQAVARATASEPIFSHRTLDVALRWMSIAAGFAYLLTGPWQPYPGSVVVKGLSVGALAAIAFLAGSPILGAALALSSLGDVLLDLDPVHLFVYGLASFLFAHLVYTVLFLRSRRRPIELSGPRGAVVILVVFAAASLGSWLIPSLGNLMVPVAIYMFAITAMVVSAIIARFASPWVAVGAILFLISDSVLAINKFKMTLPYRDIVVWSTYYLGQYAIATGFLSQLRRNNH